MSVAEMAYQMKSWTQHREMDYLAAFFAMPALRAVWGMSAVGASGQALDLGPLGLHLTRNGSPQYDYTGLVNYAVLNGSTDYLSRANEAALNITGTEAYVANPGLTLGGWFWFDSLAGNQGLISKYTPAGDQRSYMLYETGGVVRGLVNSTGGGTNVAHSGASVATAGWYFAAMRYIPSTSLSVFVNGEWSTLFAGIPASLYVGSADLLIGSYDAGSNLLTGRACLCFLCAAAASDAQIRALYQRTRPVVP